jgi:hypothetical protein
MKHITLTLKLTDNLGIKSIIIDDNETELPSDSNLIKICAIAMLESIAINKEDLQVQDILNDLDIKVQI